MNQFRRKLSYANIAATLALVFSMSGGALAASHYLINSTKQINPKVLKQLRGYTGKRGATGPRGVRGATGAKGTAGAKGAKGAKGAAGAKGATGAMGPAGQSALSPLVSGQSESGDYGIRPANATTTGNIGESLTFPVPLAAGTPKWEVTATAAPTAHCPGPGRAERGYLCFYSTERTGVAVPTVRDMEEVAKPAGTGRFGFDMTWSLTAGNASDIGTYTVTAP
jgi:hypothetical protein